MLMRQIKCPFCECVNVVSAHINVLCPCGAKYYIHNDEFWNRKEPYKIMKKVPFRIFDTEEEQNG